MNLISMKSDVFGSSASNEEIHMTCWQARIGDLFSYQRQFQLLQLQRQGRWGEKQWQLFWDNVRFLAREGDSGLGTIPLGGLILAPATAPSSEGERFLVIDGQHRLVACLVFVAAIRDWERDHGNDTRAAEIQHAYLSSPILPESNADRLQLPGNPPSPVPIVSLAVRAGTPAWILDAYDFFYKKLAETEIDTERLIWALNSKLSVAVTNEDYESAIKTFFTVMTTGVPRKKAHYR